MPDTKTDFRRSVAKIPAGSILYEVFAISAPGDEDQIHVGTLTTESPFVASAFGDQVLSLRHDPQRSAGPVQPLTGQAMQAAGDRS